MLYAQTRICLQNEMHKILWNFEVETGYQIPGRRLDKFRVDNLKYLSQLLSI